MSKSSNTNTTSKVSSLSKNRANAAPSGILNKTPGHSWKSLLDKKVHQPMEQEKKKGMNNVVFETKVSSVLSSRRSFSHVDEDKVDPNLLATVGHKKRTTEKEAVISRHVKIARNQKEQELLATKRFHQTVTYLEKRTHFDNSQVKALMGIYRRLTAMSKLDRLRFRETLHGTFGITDAVMLDRVFYSFDGDNEGSVSESEWIIGLSVMLQGTLDEQIAFCYEVYDVNSDRAIGREELQICLRNCIYPIPGHENEVDDLEEGCREIVELAMKKLDLDRDGFIKYGDFYHAVNNDPILLQGMGPCLPTTEAMMTFLALIDVKSRHFSNYLSHPSDSAWERENNKFDSEVAEKIKKKFNLRTSEDNMKLLSIFKRGEVPSIRGMRSNRGK